MNGTNCQMIVLMLVDEKVVRLLISQWLPCPLAIWNLLSVMAILLNLVKL